MPQCAETLGKVVRPASAAHRAAGRQGQARGAGNPSSEAFPAQPQGTQAGAPACGCSDGPHIALLKAMLSAEHKVKSCRSLPPRRSDTSSASVRQRFQGWR